MNYLTRRGGFIIVSSGNSYALTRRFMGSKYWYCNIAEHISFINPDWTYNASKSLNLNIEHIEEFSHVGDKKSFLNFIYGFGTNILYKISPNLVFRLRMLKRRFKSGENLVVANVPPAWMAARDHIIVIFRKP